MPYVIVKDLTELMKYTGAARFLAPQREDATKAEKALTYRIVANTDPVEAVKQAAIFTTLDEAEIINRRECGTIYEIDDNSQPVAKMQYIMAPASERGFPTRVLTKEEYAAQEAARRAKAELPASTRWEPVPLAEWPKSLSHE